jgi:1-deoxy-D-xylulose-5-phosphate reductoisomerase
VLRLGGDSGAVLNAVDEVTTAAFLANRITFPAITAIAAKVLAQRTVKPIRSLHDVQDADAEGRQLATELLDTPIEPPPEQKRT